jgi:TolB-like protein/class 3 adenylate cyclase
MAETRKLAAILAADVVGYSRLAGADEDRTLARLRALRSDLIDPTVAVHNGRVVKRTGDGSLIEFRSVVDAVRCAIEVQNGMIERNVGLPPERRIEFRVGIHLGDVVEESDGDLMGDGVNIAARLEGIAAPGAICLSEDAYRQVRARLDLAINDLGPTQLKNIAEPIRVYSLQVGVPAQAKPAAQASHTSASTPPRLSIVVLPFGNLGGDPEQEYFVDGVTESLTTDLSRIDGSFVIARNTAFSYKGKPYNVKQIGLELNVRYVLEGSVQRGGNRLRVNVQLIGAEIGDHLWAERFDRPVTDLFDMQDEIVGRLANALNAQLIAAEARRAESAANPNVLDLCFRAWAMFNRGVSPETLREAERLFTAALRLDPDSVSALVGSAWTLATMVYSYVSDDIAAHLTQADSNARRALLLAPDHALGHAVLGRIALSTHRIDEAIAECEHALRLNPNLSFAHYVMAFAKLCAGQPSDVDGHLDRALRLSPRDPITYLFHYLGGVASNLQGRPDNALVSFRRAIEANRTHPLMYFSLAGTLWLLGRPEDSSRTVADGLALDPRSTVQRLRAAMPTEIVSQYQFFFDAMRAAGVPEG